MSRNRTVTARSADLDPRSLGPLFAVGAAVGGATIQSRIWDLLMTTLTLTWKPLWVTGVAPTSAERVIEVKRSRAGVLKILRAVVEPGGCGAPDGAREVWLASAEA
jgi:hypothetical protein